MVTYENECFDCAVPGYPCIGDSCPNRHVKRYYCDECKDYVEKLYRFDGEELCLDCIEKRLEVVE